MSTPGPSPLAPHGTSRRQSVPGRAGLPLGAQGAVRELEAALRDERPVARWRPSALLARFLARHRRLHRLLHYVVGSVVVLPPLHYALTPLGFDTLQTQVATAAAFGVVVALFRPSGVTVGLLLAATVVVTLALTGLVCTLTEALPIVLALLPYFGFGYALGVVERVVGLGD